MTTGPSLLRPRDTDAVRAELRRLGSEGAVPVMFGGEVHDDALLITEFYGTRGGGLRGLTVRSTFGLGGASMVSGQPLAVADYRHAPSITHDYDMPVLSEGIRSVLAVPVVVDGRTHRMPRRLAAAAHARRCRQSLAELFLAPEALTAAEVATYYIDTGPLEIPILITLMVVKFVLVVMWFMHLKFDNKIFSWIFYSGLILAVLVYMAFLATFRFFAPT